MQWIKFRSCATDANEIWMRFAFLSRSDSGSETSWLIDARIATLECGSTLTGVAE